MPCSLSPPLAPKGWQLRHSTSVLLIILLSILLFAAGSCDARARDLGVRGNGQSSSKAHLPGSSNKHVAAATSLKADGRLLTNQMEATPPTVHSPIDDHKAHQADYAKAKEGMTMASSSTVAVGATPAVRVSQRLSRSRREDTGFHLDYAGPRTHTPSHN